MAEAVGDSGTEIDFYGKLVEHESLCMYKYTRYDKEQLEYVLVFTIQMLVSYRCHFVSTSLFRRSVGSALYYRTNSGAMFLINYHPVTGSPDSHCATFFIFFSFSF